MSTLLYKHKVELDANLRNDLLCCLKTHDEIYNFAREIINKNRDIMFKQLKVKIRQYVLNRKQTNGDEKMLHVPMWNELYYQYKWTRQGLRKTNIQFAIHYLTCLGIGKRTKLLTFTDENTFVLEHLNGAGKLTVPLEIDEDTPAYWNLSYSYLEDYFMLTIFSRDM